MKRIFFIAIVFSHVPGYFQSSLWGLGTTLYDATGREVQTLANGFFAAGEHSVDFARGALAAGVYFYRLEAGGQNMTRAMVILP